MRSVYDVNLCKAHWLAVQHEVNSRGLGDFSSNSNEEIFKKIKEELQNGEPTIDTIDPCFGVSNMIFGRAFEIVGPSLLYPNPDTGEPPCPLCAVAGPKADDWIKGAVSDIEVHIRELYKARPIEGENPDTFRSPT